MDQAVSAPTHKDGSHGEVMEILPSLSCVMSHFEKDLSFEHLENWRIVYLPVVGSLRILRRDGVTDPRDPANILCSNFNEILPIQDQWSENNGHWLGPLRRIET